MTYRTIGVFFAAILGLMINAGHTMAQETADDQVVAVANGEPVYMSDVLRAASGLPEQYKNAPMDTLYPHLLERVIAMKLLAAQGEQLELDQTDEFEMQMEYVREQLLEKATLNQVVAAEITDDAVQERYQTSIAKCATPRAICSAICTISSPAVMRSPSVSCPCSIAGCCSAQRPCSTRSVKRLNAMNSSVSSSSSRTSAWPIYRTSISTLPRTGCM